MYHFLYDGSYLSINVRLSDFQIFLYSFWCCRKVMENKTILKIVSSVIYIIQLLSIIISKAV